jgi:4-amino-4-deoxy-L-arabinose transferase-like glycosyltransferase
MKGNLKGLMERNRWWMLLGLLFVLALVARLVLWVAWSTPDFSRFDFGDYALYRIGAEHLLQTGNFDNSLFLVRPPLFSLFVAVLGVNSNAVLAANVLMGAVIVPLTAILARAMGLQTRIALLAGTVAALDPTSIIYSVYLGAEAIANLLLVFALILFFFGLRARRWIGWMTAAGLLFSLSAWARPATYLLWIILAGWIAILQRGKLRYAVVLAIVCFVGIFAWILHNQIVFGSSTYSTIGGYNMLYYRAASVERTALGTDDMDAVYTELSRRVEQRLGRDTSAVDAGTRHGHYAATPALQAAMQAVALDIFSAHPLEYLITIPLGLYRILFTINSLPSWTLPIQIVWNGGLLLFALWGLVILWQRDQRALALLLALICAYYIGGTLIVQTSGIDTRARTMITPILAILAAIAWLRGQHVLDEESAVTTAQLSPAPTRTSPL